jgi:hypothetical protein
LLSNIRSRICPCQAEAKARLASGRSGDLLDMMEAALAAKTFTHPEQALAWPELRRAGHRKQLAAYF